VPPRNRCDWKLCDVSEMFDGIEAGGAERFSSAHAHALYVEPGMVIMTGRDDRIIPKGSEASVSQILFRRSIFWLWLRLK